MKTPLALATTLRRITPMAVALSIALAVALLSPGISEAQHGDLAAEGAAAEPGFPLYEKVLGPLTWKVTTDSPMAQAYFDQGLQMVYAFTLPAAIASFEEAQRHDPACAMCYFGEAWARGPYLNGGMQARNAPVAFTAIQRARDLARENATPMERDLIEAMALRYVEEEVESLRPQLDTAYAEAMKAVYEKYPEDANVGTMYAEALMLLNPERATYRIGQPDVQRFHGILESVLARQLDHPGACHLYIHATEATEEPGRAEACADLLGQAIPGSSHINHMPSHTYNEIGRWNSAVRSNIDAWHSDQRSAWGEGVSYAATHNLHMLFYAGSQAGQGGVSLRAAKAYAEQTRGGQFYEALVLLRFGWFDEILDLDDVPENPIQRGLFEFAHGYAHLRNGDLDRAKDYLARVKEGAENTPSSVMIRGRHSAAQLLGISAGILEGEILREQGRIEEAIEVFERAVEIHEGLAYDEPEPLNFAAHQWLGAALLEAGRPEDAERVYRASLEMHPRNGWSIFGLAQSLREQGREAEAAEADDWFQKEWSQADTLIRSSRF